MASQKQLQITGRIGDVVFYKRGDKYYARSVPAKVKQTKATKKCATQFGKASAAGKCLRHQLLPCIPFPRDVTMQVRLVSAISAWLRSATDPPQPGNEVPFIKNFQFTEGGSVRERWRVTLHVTRVDDGGLQLTIPAFAPGRSISAPAGTLTVKCNIAATACNIDKGVTTGGYATSLHFDWNDKEVPEQVISLPVPARPGNLVVTAVSLEYFSIKNGVRQKTTNKAFMPAGVVSAMYL
jgi:hypothetical protein